MSQLFEQDALRFTEQLCAEQTLAARTRACLLKVEHRGHRAGWNSDESNPTIFAVFAHPEKHYVHARKDTVITAMLHRTCDQQCGGEVGAALQVLAGVMEQARDTMAALDVLPAYDLLTTTANDKFYGFALRVECWATRGLTDDARRAAEEKRLKEYEHRIELRMVELVARDGLTWTASRVRGEAPQVMAMRPESDTLHQGLVPNALGRMANVIANNPVPVPQLPAEHPWRREGAG